MYHQVLVLRVLVLELVEEGNEVCAGDSQVGFQVHMVPAAVTDCPGFRWWWLVTLELLVCCMYYFT